MNVDRATVFRFLDEVRNSGKVNMFTAGVLVQEMFELDKAEARRIAVDWMETFSEDEDAETRAKRSRP